MTESRGSFETYPFNPDVPSPSGPQDPIPAQLQPRTAPPPLTPPPPPPSGFGRRVLLGFAAAAGVLVAAGGVISFAGQPSGLGMASATPVEETPFLDDPVDDEPADEPTYAVLAMGDYGEIGVEIPVGWHADSEGDYLVVSHDQGRLVARLPEWSRATRSELSKEADYLRDGFDPSGAPAVFDESTTSLTQFHQVTEGHFAGEAATEEVVLVLDPDRELAIAIWWATATADKQATVQARTMVAELRAGFLTE